MDDYAAVQSAANRTALRVAFFNEIRAAAVWDLNEQWLKSDATVASAVLQVSAAIIPEEYNLPCNLRHTDILIAEVVQAFKVHRWQYDHLLRV